MTEVLQCAESLVSRRKALELKRAMANRFRIVIGFCPDVQTVQKEHREIWTRFVELVNQSGVYNDGFDCEVVDGKINFKEFSYWYYGSYESVYKLIQLFTTDSAFGDSTLGWFVRTISQSGEDEPLYRRESDPDDITDAGVIKTRLYDHEKRLVDLIVSHLK